MLTLRLPLKRSEKGLRQTLRFRKGAKPDKSPSPPRSSHHIRNRNARDLRTVRSGLRQKSLAQRSTTFKRASQSGEPGNISSMRAGGWRTYFGGVRDCQRGYRAPERDRTQNSERGATAVRRQPERRIVSQEWDGETPDVFTTSQKLAHRIATELAKAFGDRPTYGWNDSDGSLLATWRCPAIERVKR